MSVNHSVVTEFQFEAFPRVWSLEIFLFILFLLFYIVTLVGDLWIIFLVCHNSHLHTPMYFFLANFAFMEIVLVCVVTPKVLGILLSERASISFAGCLTQSYFFFLVATATLILIAVMSYDRYVAVCNPLHYVTIMSWSRCTGLVAGSWLGGFVSVSTASVLKGNLPYCGPNVIHHFFCDSVPLMQLACIDTRLIQLLDFFLFSVVILGTFIVIVFTYTCILLAVFRIPSPDGRQKVFSTCSSHFTIMATIYVGSIFMYVIPRDRKFLTIQKTVSAVNTLFLPATIPFIFFLRNEQVRSVMSSLLKRFKMQYLHRNCNKL